MNTLEKLLRAIVSGSCLAVFATVPTVAGAGPNEESGMAIADARPAGAIERLRDVGVVPDLEFYPDDLYLVPDWFWPAGIYLDVDRDELVFETGRTVPVDQRVSVREKAARGGTHVARAKSSVNRLSFDEPIIKRISFDTSYVDENGAVVLLSPEGSLTMRETGETRLTVWIEPPRDNVDAFWPIKFEVELNGGDPGVSPDMDGSVANHSFSIGYLKCKCDTAKCGGGCTRKKCEDLTTCSGGCGSCAYTCSTTECR